MTKHDPSLVEELESIDFKELAREPAKIRIPVEMTVALAKGELTQREALGVSAESVQEVTRYAYRLLEHGHHDAAGEIFSTLVQLDPKVAYFHLGLGLALAGLGQKRSAMQAFESARELDPQDLTAQYNLAAVALEEGNKEAASAFLAEARALDPARRHPVSAMVQRLWVAHFEPA